MLDYCTYHSSKISDVNPIISNKIIKVGGRPHSSNFPVESKHYIIIYCKQQNAQHKRKVMGILPTDWSAVEKNSFTNVAVGYFGAILVKLTRQTRSNTAKASGVICIVPYI